MKQFAIIGLGNFGAKVARELTAMDCRVTAIDNDKAKVQAIQEDVYQAIIAEATDRNFLENLEPKQFDHFIISTGEDAHAAILITLYLNELEAKHIIVKAASSDHAKVLKKVGAAEAIIPEEQMAIKLAHSLARPNIIDFLPLSSEYCVVEMKPPEKFIGKKLKQLDLRNKYNIQVVSIKHSERGEYLHVPGGDYTIRSSDILMVLGKEEDVNRIKG